MTTSVLMIHPEPSVREDARRILKPAGFEVQESPELAFSQVGSPDVIVVAWMALRPVTESLRWIRSQDSTRDARLIVISPREDLCKAISSLEQGVDDCVAIPFEGDELLVRINLCLRRPRLEGEGKTLSAGRIILDRNIHQVLVDDEPLELAPTEFRLLAFLLEHQGRVFSRQELLRRAWSSNVRAGLRTVDVHVRRLRQQLEPHRCDAMIQTVRGFGYRLRADDA